MSEITGASSFQGPVPEQSLKKERGEISLLDTSTGKIVPEAIITLAKNNLTTLHPIKSTAFRVDPQVRKDASLSPEMTKSLCHAVTLNSPTSSDVEDIASYCEKHETIEWIQELLHELNNVPLYNGGRQTQESFWRSLAQFSIDAQTVENESVDTLMEKLKNCAGLHQYEELAKLLPDTAVFASAIREMLQNPEQLANFKQKVLDKPT